MCLHSAPQTGEPAIAPPNPTTGDLHWIIGSRGAIGWLQVLKDAQALSGLDDNDAVANVCKAAAKTSANPLPR
jgi:hypothetical protein